MTHMTRSLIGLLFFCLFVAAQSPQDELLNRTDVEEVRITLDPEDWAQLRANYLENTYYRATFEWRGQRVSNIGIRSRGRGTRSVIKPALRIDFNRYVSSQRFQNLRAIAVENLEQDPPMMREYLSMALFRRAGLLAPREAYIHLFVNGQDYGLHLAMENIDKAFLTRTFGSASGADNGDLYEYSWIDHWNWHPRGTDGSAYVQEPFELKTNSSSASVSVWRNMVDSLAKSNSDNFTANLNNQFDIDNFIRYLALEVFLAETDGFCGEVGTNNFYVYRRPSDKKLQFISWDRDTTMSDYERDIWHNIPNNELARKLTDVPEYRAKFLNSIANLIRLTESDNRWFARLAADTYRSIRPYAMADPVKRTSSAEFQESAGSLQYFLVERLRLLRLMLEREGVSVE